MYVTRNRKGAIVGAWTEPQFPQQGVIADTDSKLRAYLNSTPLGAKLAVIAVSIDDIRAAVGRPAMFVSFDQRGAIVGAWHVPWDDQHELVSADDPKLQAFIAKHGAKPYPPRTPDQQLRATRPSDVGQQFFG